jgi:hypothetical protein
MFGSNHRRKVQCACYLCAKAKRACDLERPCSRCVKKGIPEQCLDKKDYELYFNSPSLLKLNAKQDPNQDDDDDEVSQQEQPRILKLSDALQNVYTDHSSQDEDLKELNYAKYSALEYPFSVLNFETDSFSLNFQDQDESLTSSLDPSLDLSNNGFSMNLD